MTTEQIAISHVEFTIKVLRARYVVDETRAYAIKNLQKAIDWAKTSNSIDKVLVNRALESEKSLPELTRFANDTANLRKELISAIREAVK